MQVYLCNTYSNVQCVMKLFNLEVDSLFKSGAFLSNFEHKLLFSLSAQPDYVENDYVEKIIASTLCFMHQGIFRPNYTFNNDAYFLDFRVQIFPLICYNLNSFHINKPCIWGSKL